MFEKASIEKKGFLMNIIIDKFNSEIFNLKMGNVDYSKDKKLTFEVMDGIQKEAVNEKFQHLTIKIPSNDKESFNIALQSGFIFVDTLIEYYFDFNRAELPSIDHKCMLRDACQKDLEILKHIAKVSFSADRFHSDKNLDNSLCDKYYEHWIENSFYGFADKVIVAEYQGQPVGFTTGKVHQGNPVGRLVLSAVSDSCRGLGIYTSMIHEGVSWLLEKYGTLNGVMVGTQIETLAVQKAWVRLGFNVFDSFYTVQKYLEK
ncbi:GNAT family N-acetyltransferase [Acetatifactor muris]|nr:GNAT family N-acetyltransferase [Acetatifactor muris]MCR2046975.1 GNAT family N-acetyltransferase [Acetatifactor muris]